MLKLAVGQTLWFETNAMANKYQNFPVTVTKVGRKWAEVTGGMLRNSKMDCATLVVHGHVCELGQCYASEAEYRAYRELSRTWSHFRHELPNNVPKHLSMAQLLDIMRQLGVAPRD